MIAAVVLHGTLALALAFGFGVAVGAAVVALVSRAQLLSHVGRLMDLLDAMQGDADWLHTMAGAHGREAGDAPESRT